MTNETPSTASTAAPKLPWSAPAISEIDYTQTQADLLGTGSDLALYS